MRRLLVHPWYPPAFQAFTTLVLALIFLFLFLGPANDELNLGSYVLWYLWWAALPVAFILLGRMWCAVCPVGFISDTFQKAVRRAPAPPAFLRDNALGFLTAAFLSAHFLNLWYNFEENIAPGRIFVLTLVAFSVLFALLFRKRIWCRAFCPLGAMAALLSALSPLRVSSHAALCRSQCGGKSCLEGLDGRGGCPLLERPEDGIDPRFCNLCGECLKVCPHESCGVERLPLGKLFRPPSPSHQYSTAVLLLLGVAADSGLKHLNNWPVLFWNFAAFLGRRPGAFLELSLHALVIAAPLMVMTLLALLTGGRGDLRGRMASVAAPALPLAAAAVVGMSLRPLLIVGPMNLSNILLAGGFRGFRWLDAVRHLDGRPLKLVQFALIGLGLLWALREVCSERGPIEVRPSRCAATWASLAYFAFGAAFFWIFAQPMIT